MPVPSWPCTGAARRAPGRRRGAGIRPGSGRGRVTSVMRESGVRGVRRGGTSVTARPARGAGGGPGLVGREFEAGAPGPAARGLHRLRAHGQRLVRLHGVRRRRARPRARPRDRRPGVRRRHGHQGGGLVPRAPEQATSWAASHGGMDGLAHRSGHGTRRIGLVYATGVGECGMPPPAARPATRAATPWPRAPTARTGQGSSGGASPSGIRGTWGRRRSGGSRGEDPKRPHQSSGHRTPERTETGYYANQTAQAAPL